MLRIITLQKDTQKEFEKLIKKLLENLITMELSFPCKKKISARLRWKTICALTCLVMKMGWFFQFMFQIEIWRLYECIKDFDRFMFHKTKNKNKKWFCRSCLQCFSSESVLIKHKENCLSINGKQSVKLEEGIIESENYST